MSAAEKSFVRDVAIDSPRCEGAVSRIVLLMVPTVSCLLWRLPRRAVSGLKTAVGIGVWDGV